MQKSSGDDWTVQTLGANDGIGEAFINETFGGTEYIMPAGQNGAAAGNYFSTSGTLPVFSTNSYYYSVSKAGWVDLNVRFDGDGGTDGAGANAFALRLPLEYRGLPSTLELGSSFAVQGSAVPSANCGAVTSSGSTSLQLYYTASGGSTLCSEYGSGARRITGYIRYKAF
jgi:hypothetical protein